MTLRAFADASPYKRRARAPGADIGGVGDVFEPRTEEWP